MALSRLRTGRQGRAGCMGKAGMTAERLMDTAPDTRSRTFRRVEFALVLTRAGLVAERAARAFWPLWSLLLIGAAALLAGGLQALDAPLVQVLAGFWAAALAVAAWRGLRRFRWPSRADAEARLDLTLPGRPLVAIRDRQAIGAGDAASRAVWKAHQRRMAARLAALRPAEPDLKIARHDPFGLRYMALLAFLVALLFGGGGNIGGVGPRPADGGVGTLAAGPDWEGWAEPPAYTGKPSLYLNDLADGRETLELPRGTRITLRFYGGDGTGRIHETVSGAQPGARGGSPADAGPGAQAAMVRFEVLRDGRIVIAGAGGAEWRVSVLPDSAPTVEFAGPMKREARGKMSQPFHAADDYGVVSGKAVFRLDMAAVVRRHGLAAEPDPRDPLVLDLPMPVRGNRADFTENLVDDLSKHPWAGLPVTLTLEVTDAQEQTGRSGAQRLTLPGRRFFDPLARAVIEQRRDLLWARANGRRVLQVLRAATHRPEGFIRNESGYLILRVALRRLELALEKGLDADVQNELAEAFWEAALLFEDGSLTDARERMERAQERLSEAMRNGATDEEIADLMQELREATQDYLRQLAEQQQNDPDQQSAQNLQGEPREITQDQIRAMLDRIQELMEQGRMAEARELMEQFNQMMQNLQVTRNGQGQGNTPGDQAVEGLKETLREQQGLSDQAFRDLQERFDRQGNAGQSPQNEGQNGGQGRGQGHEGQSQGQNGQNGQDGQGRQGDAGRPGGEGRQQGQEGENGAGGEGLSLAERQRALRDRLNRQLGSLPGQGSEEGRAAREALDRAGRAMEQAEQALRSDDLAGALDNQADAMQALREGLRNLDEALAQQQSDQPGQQGDAAGQAARNGRDPLGREVGSRGTVGTDREMLQGEDVYRRARDILEEIRRRTGEKTRPKHERDYLERLLDQF